MQFQTKEWFFHIFKLCYFHNLFRSSRPEVFLGKGVPKICSKFTGEHPCRSVISIKLQSDLTEIALLHGCSLVNLLHIFRTGFPLNTSGRLLLTYCYIKHCCIRTPFPKNTSGWLLLINEIKVLQKFDNLFIFILNSI